jgi:hypothetical protein
MYERIYQVDMRREGPFEDGGGNKEAPLFLPHRLRQTETACRHLFVKLFITLGLVLATLSFP